MPPKGYQSVNIPEELYRLIQRVIKENPALGYRSVQEFVRDAVRRRLKELGYLP